MVADLQDQVLAVQQVFVTGGDEFTEFLFDFFCGGLEAEESQPEGGAVHRRDEDVAIVAGDHRTDHGHVVSTGKEQVEAVSNFFFDACEGVQFAEEGAVVATLRLLFIRGAAAESDAGVQVDTLVVHRAHRELDRLEHAEEREFFEQFPKDFGTHVLVVGERVFRGAVRHHDVDGQLP